MARKLVTDFLSWLRHDRRYSEHTINAYRRDLEAYFTFLKQHLGHGVTEHGLMQVRKLDVTSFLADGHDKKKLGKATMNRRLSSIRSFYKFLARHHKLVNTDVLNARGPRQRAPVPYALKEEETQKLLDYVHAAPDADWQEKRDYALMMMLYGLGLRISEALGLNLADVERDALRVHGKGNKERVVPVIPQVKAALDVWLNAHADANNPNAPLYIANRGGRLNARYVQRYLEKLRLKLGLSDKLTPHALRHCFATHLLRNGADLRTVQELLGHESLSTTQRYLASDYARLQEVYNNAHPLERERRKYEKED